jgi:hypothetical protein
LKFEGLSPKKEARPIDRAHPYALRRNILRKRQKTMGCLAFGEPDLVVFAHDPFRKAGARFFGIMR